MIKYFGKIRQRLLAGDQFSKYLLYAIGEILLVVIGILIALQINTWNEARKDRQLEANYLDNLKEELIFNIQLANEQILFSVFQAKNGELILTTLEKGNSSNPTDLAVALEHIAWNHEIIFVSDVWNELYATGNIGIIRNKQIKSKLTDLYNDMKLVNKFQEHEWSSYNFGVRRLIADILAPDIRLMIDANLEPGNYAGEDFDISNPQMIIKELQEIEGLKGYIVDIIQTRKTSNLFMANEISAIESIIALIDFELE